MRLAKDIARCRRSASRSHPKGDLMLLGAVAYSTLEGVPTICRATALAAGDAPANDDEARVAASLNSGWSASEAIEAEFQLA